MASLSTEKLNSQIIQRNKLSYCAQLNALTAKQFNLKRKMRKYNKEDYFMADWDTVDEWEAEWWQRVERVQAKDARTWNWTEECCEEPTQVEQHPAQVQTPLQTPTPVQVPQQPY